MGKKVQVRAFQEIASSFGNIMKSEKTGHIRRLGWRFIRIRGSEFYKEPEGIMEWAFNELDNYDIRPMFDFRKGKTAGGK
jgi:hypothetical protein